MNPWARAVSLFQAVSNKAEAANCLIIIEIAVSVSLFRDFRGRGLTIELGCAAKTAEPIKFTRGRFQKTAKQ
jgi:hypothetical protein